MDVAEEGVRGGNLAAGVVAGRRWFGSVVSLSARCSRRVPVPGSVSERDKALSVANLAGSIQSLARSCGNPQKFCNACFGSRCVD